MNYRLWQDGQRPSILKRQNSKTKRQWCALLRLIKKMHLSIHFFDVPLLNHFEDSIGSYGVKPSGFRYQLSMNSAAAILSAESFLARPCA